MCAKCSNRKAWTRITVRVVVVLVCETCAAELYRAGLITRDGRTEVR